MKVGIDLVDVSRIAASIDAFGDRFLRRVFTAGEIAYAQAAPALTVERRSPSPRRALEATHDVVARGRLGRVRPQA